MNEKSGSIRIAINRRTFAARLAALAPAIGFAGATFGAPHSQEAGGSLVSGEVSHDAESIHQQIVFKAGRARVYNALTDSAQFTKVTALLTDMAAGPAEISSEVGGSFSLFGGRILGRHLELVPNERIVQAWRVAAWDEGIYSIVKFVLKEEGSTTRIIFDHTGFPVGDGASLASGWKSHYWEPLEKFFAS